MFEASNTNVNFEHRDLVISIPALALEGFLYRELISIVRENSELNVSLVSDALEMQKAADLLVWLQEPHGANELQGRLVQTRRFSTLRFSPYIAQRLLRGRMAPVSLDDMNHFMATQYEGYERFVCFGEWNDHIRQRRQSTIHVDSPQAQWQMIRWANCIGLLPDKFASLNHGVKRLPVLLEQKLELDVWVGIRAQSTNLLAARMIAKRIVRAFRDY